MDFLHLSMFKLEYEAMPLIFNRTFGKHATGNSKRHLATVNRTKTEKKTIHTIKERGKLIITRWENLRENQQCISFMDIWVHRNYILRGGGNSRINEEDLRRGRRVRKRKEGRVIMGMTILQEVKWTWVGEGPNERKEPRVTCSGINLYGHRTPPPSPHLIYTCMRGTRDSRVKSSKLTMVGQIQAHHQSQHTTYKTLIGSNHFSQAIGTHRN